MEVLNLTYMDSYFGTNNLVKYNQVSGPKMRDKEQNYKGGH